MGKKCYMGGKTSKSVLTADGMGEVRSLSGD